MESREVRDRIRTVFRTNLGLEIPSDDTDLLDAGILDTMSFVELLLHLESNFGIAFNLSDIDFENFRSVQKIARYISSRRCSEVGQPAA